MTYSLIGHCPDTGAFGAAIATSSLGVGNRCIRLAHRRGAFLSQHRTDSRLGDVGIAALERGADAATALAAALASTTDSAWRQLAALDAEGRSAAHHGALIYSIHGHSAAPNVVALGNIVANDRVVTAIRDGFLGAEGASLADRLLAGLEAGRDAGGEVSEPVRSSALRVTGEDGIDEWDLRVDRAEEAVAALKALKTAYGEQAALLRAVALRPDEVPVNRRLFHESLAQIEAQGLDERFPTARRAQDWTLAD